MRGAHPTPADRRHLAAVPRLVRGNGRSCEKRSVAAAGHQATLNTRKCLPVSCRSLWMGIHCYAWRMASAFRCLHAFHVVLQLIETLVPNRALRHHPVFSCCERLW